MSSAFVKLAVLLLCAVRSAQAEVVCAGALTSAQADGLETMFKPVYSPALTNVGKNAASDVNMSKKLSKADVAALAVKARVAASATVTKANAEFLQKALNANAQASVPGWLATALGIPAAWIGITADVAIQLINASGDAGRLSAANLAGRVLEGSNVSITESVAKDTAGKPKFVYYYAHTTVMDGKSVKSLLRSCQADVVET